MKTIQPQKAVYTSKSTTFPKVIKNSKVQLSTPQCIPPHTLEENNPKLEADHNATKKGDLDTCTKAVPMSPLPKAAYGTKYSA